MGFWRSIWRVVVVACGFLLAACAAIAVLLTLGLERITRALQGSDVLAGNPDSLVEGLFAGLRLFSAMTLLPALALVVVGEVARIRSSVFYIVGGGAAMAAIPLLGRLADAGAALPAAIVWQVFATAGFAGGLVYWLLAGRGA